MVYKTLNLVLLCMFIILFIYILNIIKNDFCEKFDTTTTNPLTTNPLTTNPLSTNPLTTNPLSTNPLTKKPYEINVPIPSNKLPILDTKDIILELNDGYKKMNEYRFKKLDRQDDINKLNTKINKLITKINTSFTNNITPDTNTMIFY